MPLVEINRNPTRRDLGWFAGSWLLLFAVLGGIAWARSAPQLAIGLWSVALAMPAFGLLWPVLGRAVYLAVAYVTYPIGFVVSHVILAAVYFLVLTPIGLAARLAGHDPLELRDRRGRPSYWRERTPAADPGQYFRQY